MSNQYGHAQIVKDGLQLCVDANDVSSYPGSGTTWYDLSGNGWNFTLTGNITLVGTQGKDAVFHTGGTTSDYISTTSFNYASQNYTVMTATRYASSPTGRALNAASNNWLLGNYGGDTRMMYCEGWVTNEGTSDQKWRIYAGTGDIAGDNYEMFIDNSGPLGNGTGGSAGPNGFSVGTYRQGNSEPAVAEVGFVLLYNRILSTEELTQNFEVQRSRFKI